MNRHESPRGYFAYELHQQMAKRDDIVLLTGDLGFGMWDSVRNDFPNRFYNCGASEQAMIGMATGMAYRGLLPVVYSITNFVLYRPFEFIRNYIDHEKTKVILAGGGRDMDYEHDGWTHHSPDAKAVLACLPNIRQFWPDSKEDVPQALRKAIESQYPSFISLQR